MRKLLIIVLLTSSANLFAQDPISYQLPPKDIVDLVLATPTPTVSFDSKGEWMLIMDRSSMPGVEELAQPELRIAGLRINPNNAGPSRSTYVVKLLLKQVKTGKEFPITGLPARLKAGNFQWSPAENKISFTQTNNNSIDLYVIDVKSLRATKINKQPVNLVLGNSVNWINEQTVYYTTLAKPMSQVPKLPLAPTGPVIQENLGKVAASPTYQDLIKNPHDEALFAFYGTVQLMKNKNGIETPVGAPAIYYNIEASPDNNYLLLEKLDRPFSYLVPARGFNSSVYITDLNGKQIKLVAKLPSRELAPTGYDNVLNAPRSHGWLDSEAATLTWIEPLDSGLIKKKMDFHDAAFALRAPFSGSPQLLVKTPMRLYNLAGVNSNLVLVTEGSRVKHVQKISRLNPGTGDLVELINRSTDDAYGDPGSPVRAKNKFGRYVPQLIGGSRLLMTGAGSSPNGDLPFLRSFDIVTKETKELWRSAEPSYEVVTTVLDAEKMLIVTNRQSITEQPNYYLRDLTNKTVKALTAFPDPQPGLRGIVKQKISYKRQDGVDLSADLYLPKGYDMKKDGPLPVFMWAYPREFKSAADAAQVRGSKYTFTRIASGSSIFLATQGFAVMDNTDFPIVGEGDKQPNDNFVEQLQWSAEAAIRKVAEMGVGDSTRVGVGGHSYGAFMTSNLLAHTKLFKAGIARSGAYNRSLTPFGFQNEERTYWQAPDVYFKMSPFSYANQVKTPLLMIHGEADNNPGTFPIQSERLYNAIKGHGGTVRFVLLPFESHGYTAKENVLHMLWEMNTWLTKYVKNAGK
jgi:dipeptidyl aminopeptidase/acylaminoacyl peptidase